MGVGSIAEMGFELAANLISLIFLSFEAFMRMQGAGLLAPYKKSPLIVVVFPASRIPMRWVHRAPAGYKGGFYEYK